MKWERTSYGASVSSRACECPECGGPSETDEHGSRLLCNRCADEAPITDDGWGDAPRDSDIYGR